MEFINIYGIVFMLLIMLPNIVFALRNKAEFENKYHNKTAECFEQAGRYGCFTLMIVRLPFLFKGFWFENAQAVYILVNSLLVLAYCLCWMFCWNKNTLFKVIVLSVLPTTVFLVSGILLGYVPLIMLSVVFGFCHILISYKNAVL